MADKPITFSAPMVRALLAGTKTQTRRLLSPSPEWLPEKVDGFTFAAGWQWKSLSRFREESFGEAAAKYAPIRAGDRVYVREAYYQFGHWEPVDGKLTKGGKQKWAFVGACMVRFDAPEEFVSSRDTEFPGVPKWYKRLGRFMPRTESRMWLEITDVRVQRLQDISEQDCVAEGIEHVTTTASGKFYQNFQNPTCPLMAYGAYRSLWDHINGDGAWADNPWIVAYTFTVHHGNIDGGHNG